jgi:hypothetical protein
MTALKELKPIWQGKKTGNNLELVETQYKNLIALGAKEGLSLHFVHYKLHEIATNCKECNQQITIEDTAEKLCPDCYEKNQRQEWLEECEEAKRKEDPIERYCHKIRGTIPYYERPFILLEQDGLEEEEKPFAEEYKRIMSGDTKNGREEAMREEWSRRKEEQRYQDIKNKPEGMTKVQWIKEGRRKRQLQKEESKQAQLDQKFKYRNSPISMFEDMIGKISCECDAEQMRQGIVCKTCKLITKLNQYTLDLFKDASEGRSTII